MLKKNIRRIISALLCLLLLAPQAVFAANDTYEAVVKEDKAYLRVGPSSSEGAKKVFTRGSIVIIDGPLLEGENGDPYTWYHAVDKQNSAFKGYIRSDQIQISGAVESETTASDSAVVSISGKNAIGIGETLHLSLSVNSDVDMGAWLFKLTYNKNILQYVSGADSESSGELFFCNWSSGTTSISYDLVFTATKAGTTYLTISSPQIVAYSDETELEANSVSFSVSTHTHQWGAVSYSWNDNYSNCLATRCCSQCDAKEEENSKSISTENVPATCNSVSKVTYTASFTNAAFGTHSTTVNTGSAYFHVPSIAVRENQVPATCTVAGSYDEVVYCADCGEEMSRENKSISALGHAWGDVVYSWSADNTTCTATRVCGNDTSHVESETVNATSAEAGESVVYTAVFNSPAFQRQIKEVVTAPSFVWGDANGDGKVSNSDIVRLKNYFANYDVDLKTSTYELHPGADANGDGKVSNSDIVRLKNYFANYDVDTFTSSYVLGPST